MAVENINAPLMILQWPLAYMLLVILSTVFLKKHIITWFEHVLYVDDEEEEQPL